MAQRHKARRLWLPWRSRTRAVNARLWDRVPTDNHGGGDDPISAAIGCFMFILVLPWLVPALLILPFFLAECLLQWIFALPVLLVRSLGGARVPVRVMVDDRRHDESIAGWGAAKRYVEQINASPVPPNIGHPAMSQGTPEERGWETPEQRQAWDAAHGGPTYPPQRNDVPPHQGAYAPPPNQQRGLGAQWGSPR